MIASYISNNVFRFYGNILRYFASRTERERVLMLIVGVVAIVFMTFQVFDFFVYVTRIFQDQVVRLNLARQELNLYLDPVTSPIQHYVTLRNSVNAQEERFSKQLRNQGSITVLESLLKEKVGDRNFTIEDSPQQSFQEGIYRIPFKISFKTGSLKALSQVLRDMVVGKETFSLSKMKVEKTYQKYLQVDIEASALVQGGQ
jgi:hypothetical protein